jgi:hypothetical protein
MNANDNPSMYGEAAYDASFDAEVGRIAAMTSEEVKNHLRQIGIEPVNTLPAHLHTLVVKSRRMAMDTERTGMYQEVPPSARGRTLRQFALSLTRSKTISEAEISEDSGLMQGQPIALERGQASVIVLAQRTTWNIGRYLAKDNEIIPDWVRFLARMIISILLPPLGLSIVTEQPEMFVLMLVAPGAGAALGFLMFRKTSSSSYNLMPITHIPNVPSGPSTSMKRAA